MAKRNQISPFNIDDILKYHRNELTPVQRNAIEKAALEDPFLADALEGYQFAGPHPDVDLANLKLELENKLKKKNRKAIGYASWRQMPFLRVAALLILVVISALFASRFFTGGDTKTISQAKVAKDIETEKLVTEKKDTSATVLPGSDTNTFASSEANQSPVIVNKDNKKTDLTIIEGSTASVSAGKLLQPDTIPVMRELSKAKTMDNQLGDPNQKWYKDSVAANAAPALAAETMARRAVLEDADSKFKKESAPQKQRSANFGLQVTHVFRGRVLDSNNNAIPFANVTNIRDNVGTYTDARGFFNLISGDSVLNVQVKSIGFSQGVSQLQSKAGASNIILKEDRSIAAQTLSGRRINTQRHLNESFVKLEGEPEPEDGWENYDSYLSNNLNLPAEAKAGRPLSGEIVELSFEVDKDGVPINFKVEKSLCSRCDEEAIRLVRDGPKWKRKKNKRTRVAISF